MHAVTGFWVSSLLVMFLVSGLPWSFVWGHALQTAQHTIGRLTSIADWEIGSVPARDVIAGGPAHISVMTVPPAKAPGMDMPGMDMGEADGTHAQGAGRLSLTAKERDITPSLDRIVSQAGRMHLYFPVLITPPASAGITDASLWHIRSDTQDRPRRVGYLVSTDGGIRMQERFADKPALDRVIAYGVAAHEGQLFGPLNQAINAVVAIGLLLMSMAATMLWIRRRPTGRVGMPPALPDARTGPVCLVALVILGVLLPELGLSLLLIALIAWVSPRRASRKRVDGTPFFPEETG